MSVAQSFRDLIDTHASLSETALKVKDQRDEAIELLRESLIYSATGNSGAFKTKVRLFLARVGMRHQPY